MYSQGQKNESFVASGDLSACVNRIVDLLSTDFKVGIATAAGGFGVLANAPKHGEHASVATDGVVMVRVGAAVTNGDDITSATSGWGTKVTSGAGQRVVGRAETGAASGMLAAVRLGQYYRPNSVGN
jgi:hypothetical protein